MLKRFVKGFGAQPRLVGKVGVGAERWSAVGRPGGFVSMRKMFSTEIVESPYVNEVRDEGDWDMALSDNPKPVVVVFYTDWCPNSAKLLPKIMGHIEKKNGEVELLRVNIDNNREICEQIKIPGIPTVFMMRMNQVIDSFNGDCDEKQQEHFFDVFEFGNIK